MSDLYNTVLATYTAGFQSLPPRSQFHFASRRYLWSRDEQSNQWLSTLRADFTANDNATAACERLLNQPLPALSQTGQARQPYFENFPQLREQERLLFRLLFMHTVYGLENRTALSQFYTDDALTQQHDALLHDSEALAYLSSFGVNYLYLLDRFIRHDESALPLEQLVTVPLRLHRQTPLERQLQLYFYTHCMLGESLFYGRAIPAEPRPIYQQMLQSIESILAEYIDQTKLDNLFEFLVCCRMLDYQSPLELEIYERAEAAVTTDGFIGEPLDPRMGTLQKAEHRNVLFLISHEPYRPQY